MQTPKARTGSSEVPQRKSSTTPRTARQLKLPGADSDSVSSTPSPMNKTPKGSPKVNQLKSPRSPALEKKGPSRVSELESQFAQLQENLKKAKEQLNVSDSWKRRAQQEAEEAKKHLSAMSAKLEESQQQLLEITTSEDARVDELRKISQDRDKAWQSELDAVQKQYFMDSAALASAMNEIQRLKVQLEKVAESEVAQTKHAESAYAEMQNLRIELTETLSLIEKLKNELSHCKEFKARALEDVGKTQIQLETANANLEMLRCDGFKAKEAYNSLSLELEQSKARVKSLEELVSKLQTDLLDRSNKLAESMGDVQHLQKEGEKEEIDQLKGELNLARHELSQLRSALDASEIRYQEEYIQSTLQIRSAYEQVERAKSESGQREAELEAELKNAKASIEELRANLMDKETELQNISEENEGLSLKIKSNESNERDSELAVELKKLEAEVAGLKASILNKETEMQSVTEQNEMLKMEIEKREMLKASILNKETEMQSVTEQNEMLKMEIEKTEMERNKVKDEAISLAEAARAAEREALMKVGYLTKEADKNSRRAARVTEQLDAAQAANTELEAELRKLKVQSDQWRKAAEAATAMLSTGNSGKFVERTGSLDNRYSPMTGNMDSPYSEEIDDDSPFSRFPGVAFHGAGRVIVPLFLLVHYFRCFHCSLFLLFCPNLLFSLFSLAIFSLFLTQILILSLGYFWVTGIIYMCMCVQGCALAWLIERLFVGCYGLGFGLVITWVCRVILHGFRAVCGVVFIGFYGSLWLGFRAYFSCIGCVSWRRAVVLCWWLAVMRGFLAMDSVMRIIPGAFMAESDGLLA